MVSVCTYNILSTKLVSPEWHVGVPTKYLETNYRWNLIKEKIAEKIKDDYIICIQELSEEWLTRLLVLFNSFDYTFIYDSGYLGVGIAFPRKYRLDAMNIVCVGDELRKQCKPFKKNRGCLANILDWFASWRKKEIKDNWQLACDRKNRYVRVTLSDEKDQQFDVYTYHMPCAFTNKDLMYIQASGLFTLVNREANYRPYILAGDFNSKPGEEVYNMITMGVTRDIPSTYFYQVFNFCAFYLKSAYKEVNGIEPPFTCSAYPKGREMFRDTIDYIFYRGFEANSTSELQTKRLPEVAYPCAYEGSDHIMISAELSLIKKEED